MNVLTESFNDRLDATLHTLEDLDLFRSLPTQTGSAGRFISIDDTRMINFSSNDYLGLASDQNVVETAQAVLERYGLGSGGSRLVSGNHPLYTRLEDTLADWKGRESAVVFGSGYLTSIGVIRALMTGRDLILYDSLSHRCLIEGTRLSNAEHKSFPHSNLNKLRDTLETKRGDYDNVLIVVEGIYSMDGDRCPLDDLLTISSENDAWVLVDEAHSAGVWGPDGAGLTRKTTDSVEVSMGTLSKAVGGYGGYVAGSSKLKQFLINRATPLIYSTGLPASVVAGNLTAVKFIRTRSELRENLQDRVDSFAEWLDSHSIPRPEPPSQIFPVLTGSVDETLKAGKIMSHSNLYTVPIRYPTVPRHKGRIRISLRADHTESDLEKLQEAIIELDRKELLVRGPQKS